MKNKQNYTGKANIEAAQSEYLDTLNDRNAIRSEEEDYKDTLLIRSYALDPSIDAVLWNKSISSPVAKPFRLSGKAHGIIDYAFAATLLIGPSLLGLKNKWMFGLFGAAVATSAALTKDSQGIKPVLSLKTHRAMDVALLSGLAVAAATKPVRQSKSTLGFTLSLLALGVTTVLLTDWNVPSTDKSYTTK